MNQTNAVQQQPIQIFTGMSPEAFQMLRPSATPATPVTPAIGPDIGRSLPSPDAFLFSASIKPSTPLQLADFCMTYTLKNEILNRFSENGFETLNQLCYITLNDLKEMEFKRGEIAGIQDAIATWSKGREPTN